MFCRGLVVPCRTSEVIGGIIIIKNVTPSNLYIFNLLK